MTDDTYSGEDQEWRGSRSEDRHFGRQQNFDDDDEGGRHHRRPPNWRQQQALHQRAAKAKRKSAPRRVADECSHPDPTLFFFLFCMGGGASHVF